MAYIGVQPTAGQYRKLDNISASFNGSTTSFTTSVGGTNVTAGTAQQLIVSLGGVIQQPDTDYTVSTNTITFTTAPTSGLDFFAILMGDALNTVTPSDGSVTTSKLAGSLSVGLADGTVSAPSLFFTGDTNCGLYSPSDDQLAVTTNGVERVEWGTSEVVFNDGGTNYDFRVEGDTNANLLFVDASADAVGIGTSSPAERLHLSGTSSWVRLDATAAGGGNFMLGSSEIGGSRAFSIYDVSGSAYRLSINSSGNVGIGTTTVDFSQFGSNTGGVAIADIGSTNTGLKISDGSYHNYLVQAGNGNFYISHYGAGDTVFSNGTSGEEACRIDASRRLLVGTSTAQGTSIFQAVGNSAASTDPGDIRIIRGLGVSSIGGNVGAALGYIKFGALENTVCAQIEAQSDATWSSTSDTPGRLVFSTTADGASSPTERMRINNEGQFKTLTTSTNGHSLVTTQGASGSINLFLGIRSATNVNDGTAVYVVYSNGTYATLSDETQKKNIESARSGYLEDLKQLRVVKYNWKDQDDSEPKELGLIAQEVEQVFPGLVSEIQAEDGEVNKGVKAGVLPYMLLKALQEATSRIEALEAEVAALKAQ